jgi:hypothetical protein
MQTVKLISRDIVAKLANDVSDNLHLYLESGFAELSKEPGWLLETDAAEWDSSIANKLMADGSPESEIANSLLIYEALPGMTPAMARDERIWTRLCHIDCIDYVRSRWLKPGANLQSRIMAHCFATGLTGCRDDNAIGRLWWNAHIAKLAIPDNVEVALRRLLARANIRLQIIDRADTAFRQPLIAGIVRKLADPWFETNDAAVADFGFEVNRASGGVIFEALTEAEVDKHLEYCLLRAKARNVSQKLK